LEAKRSGKRAWELANIPISDHVETSFTISLAPARLLATNANWVDLDDPLLLARDREHGLCYQNGRIAMPASKLWG